MSGALHPKPLLSVSQAAELAGVSRSVAYTWARLGCLPGAVHVGGRWYVRRLVLLAWLGGDAGLSQADGTAARGTRDG